MVESHATFPQTGELRSRPRRSGRSSVEGFPRQHDQLSFRGRSPRSAMARARLPGSSRADVPAIVTHQKLPRRYAPARNREPKLDSLRVTSLQFRRNLADKVLDPFSFVSVANQKCVWRSHNDKIMNSEQGYCCTVFLEHDVIAGIERGDAAVCSVSLFVLLKIIRHCSPASDVIPVEAGLHHKDAIRFFHDRIIK